MVQSHERFLSAINLVNTEKSFEDIFKQEEALFSFFANGLSTIECFFYSAYSVASFKNPIQFPILKPKDLRNIKPDLVLKKFCRNFCEGLTSEMKKCLDNDCYKQIKDYRNYLSHRGRLPRNIGGGENGKTTVPMNPTDLSANWEPILALDKNTTRPYYEFLVAQSFNLIKKMEQFCKKQF